MRTSNTPAIRLEQTNRRLHGPDLGHRRERGQLLRPRPQQRSRLPFRICPGAPTSSIDINAGNVGIGTASPAAVLDVARSAAPSLFLKYCDGRRGLGSRRRLEPRAEDAERHTWPALTPAGQATSSGALQQNTDEAALENRAAGRRLFRSRSADRLQRVQRRSRERSSSAARRRRLPHGLRAGGSDVAVAPADLGGVALVAIKGLAGQRRELRDQGQVAAVEAKIGVPADLGPGERSDRQPHRRRNRGQAADRNAREAEHALSKRLSKLEKTVKALARKR